VADSDTFADSKSIPFARSNQHANAAGATACY